jgi:hypothetical protein
MSCAEIGAVNEQQNDQRDLASPQRSLKLLGRFIKAGFEPGIGAAIAGRSRLTNWISGRLRREFCLLVHSVFANSTDSRGMKNQIRRSFRRSLILFVDSRLVAQ